MYFDDATLTILSPSGGAGPGEDFSCDVTGALLEPDVATEIRNYLCGPKTTQREPTWKLTLDYDQNWALDGLSTFLEAHAGELGDFVISSVSLGQDAAFTARIKPGPYGGNAGEIAEATVELDVDGKPTFTAPVAAEPEAEAEAEPELEDAAR